MELQPVIKGIIQTGEDKANDAELKVKDISKEHSKVTKRRLKMVTQLQVQLTSRQHHQDTAF